VFYSSAGKLTLIEGFDAQAVKHKVCFHELSALAVIIEAGSVIDDSGSTR
jgi:hypothetical protein